MITYNKEQQFFQLDTEHTSYCMSVLWSGQIEHVHYGNKITVKDPTALLEKHYIAPGNTSIYAPEHERISLEDVCLEMSGVGKGDIREPFIELQNEDGSTTTDFVFESAEITHGKPEFQTLPGSYADSYDVEHLTILMVDKNKGYHLELHYYVYPECDVITRSVRFVNDTAQAVTLQRLMSMQLDVSDSGYVISSFHGGWAREMNKHDMTLTGGRFVNASFTGGSSSRSNPFVMAAREDTTERYGECFGFNLIYSGNHYTAAEVNCCDKTRFVSGINPQNFAFEVKPGEDFEAPEAVMTYSNAGHNGMSQNMHAFIRKHIVRGEWRDKERPILLNSWEAVYFEISESRLLKLAKEGAELGIELFVMDDGWFGERDNDTSSLGDWTVDRKKLPGGLKGIADKVNQLGMDFGIWVEPEMISVNSRLYKEHPDWAIDIPGMAHSEGRTQRLLDFSNQQVVEYIIEAMSNIFSSANITYVKWDYNRNFTDYYSHHLDAKNQQEIGHRYICGVYRVMKELTRRFPKILFEGCASGGNRFDLGILCYFPQIWGSDCTDAIQRLTIQNGYSYGYPMSVIGAHVSSSPNHQTLREASVETRFNVASFGILGYETNLSYETKEEKAAIKEQIALYKTYRKTMQFGNFYRGRFKNVVEWTVVSPDKRIAVGMICQKMVQTGTPYEKYKAVGLDPSLEYHFYGRYLEYHVKEYGDLVNQALPAWFHINPNNAALMDILNKINPMVGEKEDYSVYGDALMYAGVNLMQAFIGLGYSFEYETRHFPDYASRIYFMEAKDA